MTCALLDMSEQYRHVLELMLAIWQPAFWLLLCAGFVLASAHLLTMLGTRWGDRRVSPKALLFSLAVHLSLLIAVVAMIPEYRQHMLSLGRDDPPITIELETSFDEPRAGPTAGGSPPVWDRLPDPLHRTISRSLTFDAPPPPEPQPDRPTPIQLADLRPVERVELPESPSELPQPTPRAAEPSPPQAPSVASWAVDLLPPQARPDVAPPRSAPERTPPPRPSESNREEVTGRPPALTALDQRPPARSSEPVPAALAPSTSTETPVLAAAPRPPQPTIDRPAPLPLPMIAPNTNAAASEPSAPGTEADSPRLRRARTHVPLPREEPLTLNDRPGLVPQASDFRARDPDRPLLPSREDPPLPELYRPGADPDRAVGPESLARIPATFGLRTDQERKDEAIRKYGGTEDSQRAVERALRWLVSVQEPDGRWKPSRFDAGNGPADPQYEDRPQAGRRADTGITALVVLALLGNGNSLHTGPYSVPVERGVHWLIQQQHSDGSLAGDALRFEAMYCHGMATLALAEAYAMETDAATRALLRSPLERALQYSAAAQLSDGGWRYLPHQLGGGDMSMFGWQLMAFRSAQDAGLPMPEQTRAAMLRFLRDRSLGPSGALAGYRAGDPPTPAMTAEALFCKQMLGLNRNDPAAADAVRYLLQHRPRLADLNLYYWYYGTLAMFQHGGTEWEQWNNALRDLLVSEQVAEGPFAGSWEPRDLHARYGGRLYSTALATLCLEVYYRRLPMYQWGVPPSR